MIELENSTKIERVCRRAFPGRTEFSEEERRIVRAVISAVYDDSPRSRIPRSFHTLHSVFTYNGKKYRTVRRSAVTLPKDACIGCALKAAPCYGLRCSSFDRDDRLNVWFEEVV